MVLFEDFKGMVKELYIWQKLLKLPFMVSDKIKEATVAYNFNRDKFYKGGWDSLTKYGYQQRV